MTDETYKRARKEAKKQPKRKHFPLNAPYSVIYRTPLKKKFSKDFRAKVIKQNFFSSFASCFFQKILFPNDSPHFFSENLTRSCKCPSTHFFMKRPENMKHEFNVRACLKNFTNPTFCSWTRISWMEFRTRMERTERIVRNVCHECNERNERYKRNERKKCKTGNSNRRWRNSSLLRVALKIQQFWVNFQRFDINIFNFPEHFPPPNFAYSAHNFSLPSPN